MLEGEAAFLDALPCAQMYEQSFMHRDHVTLVAAARSGFFISASQDGHIKLWKKQARGVEFVKHFRAHLSPVAALAVSPSGRYCATVAGDRALKLFDVVNFDMVTMIKLGFAPGQVCFAGRDSDVQLRVAVADAEGAVHVLDALSGGAEPVAVVRAHRRPVSAMAYNPQHNCVVSADAGGKIEYWDCDSFRFPKEAVSFSSKLDTDLFALAKRRACVHHLAMSPEGDQFVARTSDHHVYVFRFGTGKLRRDYDESLLASGELMASGDPRFHVDALDRGRRLAVEKDMMQSPAAAYLNATFDQTGHFVLYATPLGIKVVNILTNRVCQVLGKVEDGQRFLAVALFQGSAAPQKRLRGAGSMAKAAEPDPTLMCCALNHDRVYLFSRHEPRDEAETGGAGRDVFNEKPKAEDIMAARALEGEADGAGGGATSLPRGAVLHTNKGDVHLKLCADECPKTVENFVGHSKAGFYQGLTFHRVIKGFMIQGGCPLGDGTGGQSIWGGEFEDEFHRDLRHDRPFILSMANAGPNTNGSQFFITTAACPWLDNKHTVFGRVLKGADVVQAIENSPVGANDKPLTDIKIVSITLK